MAARSIARSKSDQVPERDAEAQSEKRHQGGKNDGVVSADPRVISGGWRRDLSDQGQMILSRPS